MAQDPFESAASEADDQENRLAELFYAYVSRIESGEPLDRDALLDRHPALAQQLPEQLDTYLQLGAEFPSTPRPGTLGDYTLKRQIGRGGMGVVYEAWENSMDRHVALKVLPVGVAVDDKAYLRFMREAKTAGKLSHPNVVSVYGMGVKEQTPYYAMEYVEGETLAQLRGAGGAETQEQEKEREEKSASRRDTEAQRREDAEDERARSFRKPAELGDFARLAKAFADVADGLQHAHSKGVVHRDIKPSNLILDSAGRLRILDFGLARLEGQEPLTISGDVVGTPAYMSPEQARRRKIPVDHRTDIYSLGATLYELLTHQQPFQGADYNETLTQILTLDPRPPRRLNPRVPQDLETIVLKCLRKDAADRYGTAEALAQDLRRFVRGDAVEARPEGRWDKLARGVWRQRLRIVGGLVLILLSVSLGALGLQHHANVRADARKQYARHVREAAMQLFLAEITLERAQEALGMGTAKLRFSKELSLLSLGLDGDRLHEVLADLERAVELDPNRPEAPYYRARALLLLGREEEAVVARRRALRCDRTFVAADALLQGLEGDEADALSADALAEASWRLAWKIAESARKNGDWSTAESAYGRLIDLDRRGVPTYIGADVDARLGRARSRLEARNYPGAIRDLAWAAEEWLDPPEVGLLLGKAWFLLGHVDEAERTFERVVEGQIQRHDELCLWIAGLHIMSMREFERGLEWAERITEPTVKDPVRVLALYQLRDIQEAIAVGRKAVRDTPKDFSSLVYLAHSLFVDDRQKHREEILRLANEAIALNDRSSRGYELRGMMLRMDGHYREAVDAFKAALAREEHPSQRNNLGHTYMMMGLLNKAEREIRRALEDDPGRGITWWSLAELLRKSGELEEALRAAKRAEELEPRLGGLRSLKDQILAELEEAKG